MRQERDQDLRDPMPPADDTRLIDEAIVLLPEIGKCLLASVSRHPRLAGSSVPQIKALGFLAHRAPCTVGDLANGLGIAMATASEAVDRLVERDLIVRTIDPADRRRVMLALTEQGRSLTDEMTAVRRRQLRETLSRLSPDERATFVYALGVLADVLRDDIETVAQSALAAGEPGNNASGQTISIARSTRLARAAPNPAGTG